MKKKKKKIKTFLVATNVVASRPPERRLTATPTARAKIWDKLTNKLTEEAVYRVAPQLKLLIHH